MSKIVVEGVSKRFRLQTDRAHSVKELVTRRDRNTDIDHFWALKDVSLEIPEGSMYALVGHNGSGKSTLLRCIAGIYRPTEGKVTVDGRISTLLELGAGFHPDLTGRENVYMNATILGMGHKQIDKVFDEIVEFAGVQDFIDSPVKIYSSGMYVRLGFSVAIHVDPEILIIDEVIAVGDEEFQRKCFDHLYSLRRRGVTIVVVTHGMGTVQTMCDGAAWLDHGVLQMTGTGPEVAREYLRKVNEAEDLSAQQDLEDGEADDAEEERTDGIRRAVKRDDDLVITDVTFHGADGAPLAHPTYGEPLELRLHYKANAPVDEPVFGYAVFGENGVWIDGTNTHIKNIQTGKVSGVGHVSYSLPTLWLYPGKYEVAVAINDQHVQHLFDRWDGVPLSVRQGERMAGSGLTDLNGTWRLVDGPAD